MLNYIWSGIILLSLIVSFFTGKFEECSLAAIEGAGEGVTLAISLCGVMCFWSGIMEIAKRGGILVVLTKIMKPVTKILFPKIKQNSEAMSAIVTNMTANILGMSNAATPLGLKAMEELQKINTNKKRASAEMCMFVIVNTASIQLIPTTLIALRASMGSAEPTSIIVPIWITSALALLIGVSLAKIFERVSK